MCVSVCVWLKVCAFVGGWEGVKYSWRKGGQWFTPSHTCTLSHTYTGPLEFSCTKSRSLMQKLDRCNNTTTKCLFCFSCVSVLNWFMKLQSFEKKKQLYVPIESFNIISFQVQSTSLYLFHSKGSNDIFWEQLCLDQCHLHVPVDLCVIWPVLATLNLKNTHTHRQMHMLVILH